MVTQPAASPKVLCVQRQMARIHRTRSINLTQIELDSLIRALQFEAHAMTAQAAGVRGKRRSLLLAIAEANRVLIAILKAEWGEP
jgi:hypothetical protein